MGRAEKRNLERTDLSQVNPTYKVQVPSCMGKERTSELDIYKCELCHSINCRREERIVQRIFLDDRVESVAHRGHLLLSKVSKPG